ncbi:MAG: hypothetical protein QOG56_2388 [Solirubrobacteraceae bacterium]|nr:hypothetical protein [Solirubrobacteraceae bacterium]
MSPRIAVVAGTPGLVRAARELGIEVVLAAAPDAGGEPPDVVVEPADHDALVAALAPLHRGAPFARVLSLTERGLLPAAVAARELGVAGNSVETVGLLMDKVAMRERLAATAAQRVLAQRVRDRAGVEALRVQAGGVAVVKPVDGMGSACVHRVAGRADSAAAWEAIVRAGYDEAIVEEFLDGPEFSVEGFSHDGRHAILAITDKFVLDNHVEIGHAMPARVSQAQREAIVAATVEFLTIVGLREGPSHTELKLTSRGPRIVEGHNRIGGDKIRKLLLRAYGIDVVRATVAVALGLQAPPAPRPAHGGAAIRFLAPAPGIVRAVALPALPGDAELELAIGVGDRIGAVLRSEDRSGYVLCSGADRDAAVAETRRLADAIRIDVEQERAVPCA